jgi:hypothetical protein
MMKQKIFCAVFAVCLGCASQEKTAVPAPTPAGMTKTQAKTAAPDWYLDKEARYPASLYVAAAGEGGTRAEAETAAVAGVSLFFSTAASVRNEAIREFNEAVVNNTTEFSQTTYIKEDAVIRSEEEFLGVRFADPYFDKKSGRWAALAYIDRREAARIYESKIAANVAAIDALERSAETEEEDLYACGLLFRAVKIAGLTEEYIRTAAVIDSSSQKKYAETVERLQRVRSAYRDKRGGLSFSVNANNADSSGRVERALRNLLEDKGYITTGGNAAAYSVTANLTVADEELPAGLFLRPGIVVSIERSGKALFSYSKNYPRYGHKTRDGALSIVSMFPSSFLLRSISFSTGFIFSVRLCREI